MGNPWKPVASCFAGLLLILLAGCQRSGDASSPPAAAVNAANSETPPPTADRPRADPDHPIVVFDTSLGAFTVRLDAKKAPLTVENFLKYVSIGHYDQTIFHQVLKDYLILGGGYTPQLTAKTKRIAVCNEADNGLKNRRYSIAMARQADLMDSATSDFFINLADNKVLDHVSRKPEEFGYCVFGEVIEGREVIDRIGQVPVRDSEQFMRLPGETVIIKSARQVP